MSPPWTRYWALERQERRLLWEAWRALLQARIRLALGSFRAARAWSGSSALGRSPDGTSASDLARAVQRAARGVPGARCLVQALAARLLLRRRGIDAVLCLGAGERDRGGFVAHAWLERDGRPVFGDPQPERFGRFGDLPGGEGAGSGEPES